MIAGFLPFSSLPAFRYVFVGTRSPWAPVGTNNNNFFLPQFFTFISDLQFFVTMVVVNRLLFSVYFILFIIYYLFIIIFYFQFQMPVISVDLARQLAQYRVRSAVELSVCLGKNH